MLKKVIFSVIAFVIGAMVSVSIQACADDYDEISRSNSSNAYSAWCNNGIVSQTTYDAQGQVSAEYKYTYNSRGWLEKSIMTGYTTYGKRYKSSEYIMTFTYSSSGDVRYGTNVYTFYNESGQVTQTQRTTDETRLRK